MMVMMATVSMVVVVVVCILWSCGLKSCCWMKGKTKDSYVYIFNYKVVHLLHPSAQTCGVEGRG